MAGPHTLAETERAVESRLDGLTLDFEAMAVASNLFRGAPGLVAAQLGEPAWIIAAWLGAEKQAATKTISTDKIIAKVECFIIRSPTSSTYPGGLSRACA